MDAVNDSGAKFIVMLALFFLCGLPGISHTVSGVKNESQFSIKNKAIMRLTGGRSVTQEYLLNAGHVADYHRGGKYLTPIRTILHMHGQKTYSQFQNRM